MSEDQLQIAIIAVRKVVEAIGDLADWEWKEIVRKPDRFGNLYSFSMEPNLPKESSWFGCVYWEAVPGEREERVRMTTTPMFLGCHWTLYDYPKRIEERIRRAWKIAEEWTNKANEMFRTKLNLPYDVAILKKDFSIRRIYPKLVRRYFKAMKYAFLGTRKQLEEERIIITKYIWEIERKLEDGLEITEKDIKAAVGEK